jgi:hypothetical protein
MPINSLHPEYVKFSGKWQRCRDAYDGQDAIKSRGTVYLPRLSKQTQQDYAAYKERALFFSITNKTIGALVGMTMLRTPSITMPESMSSYYVDDQGVQFYEILASTVSENLLMGRIGLLVDRPVDGGDPKIVRYATESIINWDVDDAGVPQLVMLSEKILVSGEDKYLKKEELQYRELKLENGVYTQQVYNAKLQPVGPPIIPTNTGIQMDYIPFYVVTPYGISFDIEKPPMLDLVDINISHYRTSADLEHGRHFTALPTPVVSGGDATSELRVGSQTAWILPDPSARAMYLEFTGQGLQSLEKALVEKQGQLASMSARMIDNSRRGSEAPDTVRLRYASETASLTMVVRATEAALTKAYQTIAVMLGEDPTEVKILLNKELLDVRMTGTELLNMVKSYIEGGMSAETLVFNMRRGDVLAVERSDEEEIAALVTATKARDAAAVKPPTQSNMGSGSSAVN